MTLRSTIGFAMIAALVSISCKKELEPQETSLPLAATSSQVQQNGQLGSERSRGTQATAPGMNPPHGQPGHRCDIAVGAPLNSKPGTTTTASKTAPQVVQSGSSTALGTPKTLPGMNPPHGQPNHRCDIAVGAPLNTPVKTITPQVTKSPATSKAATINSKGEVVGSGGGFTVTRTENKPKPIDEVPPLLKAPETEASQGTTK